MNIKIGTRVYGLATLSVIAAAVLVSVYLFGDRLVARDVANQLDFSHLAQFSEQLKTGTLQMRRREKDFLLRKDIEYARAYGDEVGTVRKRISEIAALPNSASVNSQLKALDTGIDSLNAQFAVVSRLYADLDLTEDEGVQGRLRNAVHAVEKTIDAADLDALTVKMLMMRRHEKDFMLRGGEKYIEQIDKRRAEFDALLKDAPLSDAVKAELSSQMDTYQAGFHEYAETSEKLKSAIEQLSTIFAELTPDFDAVFAAAEAGKQSAESHLNETRVWTRQIFIYSAIAVFLLACSLGFAIGRSITRPLRGLTSAMRVLADGETSVDVAQYGEFQRARRYGAGG
ncbi:hypothetical protein [Breoghania sp.]|uniref:hypothetical protein n=1 Tax=Breoghania sp. TaxID=2065378 RepID=UPI0026246ACC|nr:hypothetical protein [Breoghania sp.]MDJ0930442.1 hypothetical protein [Breoghania sp.]